MRKVQLAAWFLRVGLAFVFIYASIEMFINPVDFLKYTPSFILDIIPVNVFLYSFGIAELLLAVWILIKWRPKYSSSIAGLLIAGIIIFNPEHFQVLFRNVAIAFGALALLILDADKKPVLENKLKG